MTSDQTNQKSGSNDNSGSDNNELNDFKESMKPINQGEYIKCMKVYDILKNTSYKIKSVTEDVDPYSVMITFAELQSF